MQDRLEELKEKMGTFGVKRLQKILQEYLDSAEVELENKQLLNLIGWLKKALRELPECYQVEEFSGPERIVNML